jgi:hypothetical protein
MAGGANAAARRVQGESPEVPMNDDRHPTLLSRSDDSRAMADRSAVAARGIPRTIDWSAVDAPAPEHRSSMGALIGQTLATNRIKLLTPIGVGGMGAVWLGFDFAERTYVAVKMILPHLIENPDAVARFQREIRILGRLRTSRTVRLRASGIIDGRPFAVMERVHGASLSRRSAPGRLLPIGNVVTIVDQLLATLEDIHAEGVTHRDVKPSNIMLGGPDGVEVTLVDFGVAASREEGVVEREYATAAGTASHMSPEQLLAESHGDPREDLWAAGVVAYECLFGRIPFEAPSFGLAHVSGPAGLLVAPTLLRAELPASLDSWFERAFARDLADRFGDASEMRAAWQQATAGIGDGSWGPMPYFDLRDGLSTLDPTVPVVQHRAPPRRRVAPVGLAFTFLLSFALSLALLWKLGAVGDGNGDSSADDLTRLGETAPSPPATAGQGN